MLKKIVLALTLMAPISCAQNNVELVTYTLEGQTKKVWSKPVLDELKTIFSNVNPQEMEFILNDPEIFKTVVQNRNFEGDMLKLEAQKFSNYLEDPAYLGNVEYQTASLPFELAFRKGMEAVSNAVFKQSVDVAEISLMVFTNDTLSNGQSPVGILDMLTSVTNKDDLQTEFALLASQYAQTPSGVQTGGYLGQIMKGQYPVVDDTVFGQKFNGLYTELLSDEYGSYIVFVHTPTSKVKVSDFDSKGIIVPFEQVQEIYINSQIKYLYTNNGSSVLVDGQEYSFEDIQDNANLLNLWGKNYNLGNIREKAQVLMGGGTVAPLGNSELLTLISPTSNQGISLAVQQIALIEKGNPNKIKGTRDFKDKLATNLKALELQTVYGIVTRNLFQSMDTNVTESELQEYYADENNRQVLLYREDGTPEYDTLANSRDTLIQNILTVRADIIRQGFQNSLRETYNITWNEDNLQVFMDEVQVTYDKYLMDNGIDTSGLTTPQG